MKNYIDIHCHILPGIDDGARNMEMSMRMLQVAYQDGIRQIIMTPHNKPNRHNASRETIIHLVEEMRERMKDLQIDIELYPGNEIFYRSDMWEKNNANQMFRLAESSYFLVEFHPMDEFEYIRNGLYQGLSEGYRPILAHVERYESVISKIKNVEMLVEMGCYMQINAGSLMGQYGFCTKSSVKKLLKQDLIHFIATDAHDLNKRAPILSDAANYVRKKVGEAYTNKLLYENPYHVLQNEYLSF